MEEDAPIADFSDEAFVQRRDPVANLIDTFSELYLDSEEERDRFTDQIGDLNSKPDDLPPPPPPLEFHEDRLQFDNEEAAQRMCSIEEHLADLEHRVSDLVTTETMSAKLKACEDRINYCLQRELDRVKQLFHSRIDDMSQSIVDCLKRRDRQLEHQLKAFKPLMSTPVHASSSAHKMSQTPFKIEPASRNRSKQVTYLSSSPNPPVKLELPTFSNLDSEDPMDFID